MSGFTIEPASDPIAPYSVLQQSGELHGAATMTREQAREALYYMVLARVFDEKGVALQRQGRFGTFSSVRGQEASVVGAAMALDPSDRKSTRLNSSHSQQSRMPSSA